MSEHVLAWHWTADTLRDGRPIPPVGETLRHDGVLKICDSGLHASERLINALWYAPGPLLHRVRCGGEIIRQSDKLCARERTIIWSHRPSDELLRGFARQQARSVLHLWDAPDVVRRYLETGDESLRAAAWAAAWDAARAVAWDAAWDAARTAAWAAARAAAGAAARAAALAVAGAAARAAVRAVAWDVARAVAWDAADTELTRLILAEANQTEAVEA